MKAGVVDLDSILDQALDDFADQELVDQMNSLHPKAPNEEIAIEGSNADLDKLRSKEQMNALLVGMQDPQYGQTLQSTLKLLSNTSEGSETVEQLFDQLAKQFDSNLNSTAMPTDPSNAEQIQSADREIAATMRMVGNAQHGMEGFEAGKMEEVGEKMMEDMMSQFESLAGKEDYNEVIDGVMRQLLSKDLMYEPAKQICDKFPEWLAIHRKSLADNEYQNYGKQYQTFQKILAVYDTEPDNFPRLMELMFDMQKYGQPPAEIIKDLAPGLLFDENGMPIMPNMGAGVFPDLPGGPGLPDLSELAGNMKDGQCAVC